MSISSLYKKLKQILQDSNVALVNRGLNEVNALGDIPSEIEKLGSINRLPYLINDEISILTEEDFGNITTIGQYGLGSCSLLIKVIAGNNVTRINSYAFRDCSKLTNVTLGNNVTQIGTYAFYGCSNLTDIYINSIVPPALGSASTAIPTTTTIHVPIGSKNAYKTATNWSNYANKIVEDIIV